MTLSFFNRHHVNYDSLPVSTRYLSKVTGLVAASEGTTSQLPSNFRLCWRSIEQLHIKSKNRKPFQVPVQVAMFGDRSYHHSDAASCRNISGRLRLVLLYATHHELLVRTRQCTSFFWDFKPISTHLLTLHTEKLRT